MTQLPKVHQELLQRFQERSRLEGLRVELIDRGQESTLKIYIANPTERLFSILEDVRSELTDENGDGPLATLSKSSSGNLLDGPEGRALIRTLSETLNINRHSFSHDFEARYTRSVAGAELQIVAAANHIVFGRRGAGKSMLLLFALHSRESANRVSLWLDLQVFARRTDKQTTIDILVELIEQAGPLLKEKVAAQQLCKSLRSINATESNIRSLLPGIRKLLGKPGRHGQDLFIFLDDFHIIAHQLQPFILDVLYSVGRGNRVFLKISAIETFTRSYDANARLGLEIPHDAQVVKLDYNLTVPDKAIKHIEAILEAQALFAGLPSIRRICTSNDVLGRLTWVSAGVPRDALYLFSQAMSKAIQEDRGRISVSNINLAASETLTLKLGDLDSDVDNDEEEPLKELVELVRQFCISKHKNNAFLVEIANDSELFGLVRRLVDLRLLHVIHEGVTIGEAGRKYLALILDYGYYIGIRAARSVDLFNKKSSTIRYRDLRQLPVFKSYD